MLRKNNESDLKYFSLELNPVRTVGIASHSEINLFPPPAPRAAESSRKRQQAAG